MEEHIWQFLTIISTGAMVTIIPLLIYIWRTMESRVSKVEEGQKDLVSKEHHLEEKQQHQIDLERVEKSVERVDVKMTDGFKRMDERMDTVMKMLANLTLQQNRRTEP